MLCQETTLKQPKCQLTVEVENDEYILTIYELKGIFKRKHKIFRTVATKNENATISAMVELGVQYINNLKQGES